MDEGVVKVSSSQQRDRRCYYPPNQFLLAAEMRLFLPSIQFLSLTYAFTTVIKTKTVDSWKPQLALRDRIAIAELSICAAS